MDQKHSDRRPGKSAIAGTHMIKIYLIVWYDFVNVKNCIV